jgi:hypothetical protein
MWPCWRSINLDKQNHEQMGDRGRSPFAEQSEAVAAVAL